MKTLRRAHTETDALMHTDPTGSVHGWSWLVFGADPQLRVPLQRSMMATFIYAVWIALALYAASIALVSWSDIAIPATFAMVGVITFYALLRSGYSLRFSDPSLTLAQMIFAIVAIMLSYVMTPPTRSAALQVLCLILVFGMFALKPRETTLVGIGLVLCVAATLLGMWWWDSPQFDWRRDGINGLLACVIMPVLSILIRHFSQLRVNLAEQKKALNLALAQVQILATSDPLTGLYNRGYMNELIEQQSKRSARSGAPLSVALIDLDHFKRINDTYGHHVGDEVLCGFARYASESLRQPEVLARWGGEEFLVLFPDTPVEDARQALERLRVWLAQQDLTHARLGLKTTFSAGLAEWDPAQNMERNLVKIDEALYQAKHEGRDRCVVSAPRGASGKMPSDG